MKKYSIMPLLVCVVTACSSADVGTKIADSKWLTGSGVLAIEQKVQGKTIVMAPKVEDFTGTDFNIRYMELSFGNGVPVNIRDLAIDQCQNIGKVAVYKGSSRGMIQLNTVKAYYECVDG